MIEPGEVKAARNRAGLTQQQLADILGVHVKTLRDFEKGKRARLRAGQAKLADFIAANPEPQAAPAPPAPTAALRPLAEASDMELIAVLSARLALLRAAVDGPIPVAVEVAAPAVVVQTVVAPAPTVSTAAADSAASRMVATTTGPVPAGQHPVPSPQHPVPPAPDAVPTATHVAPTEAGSSADKPDSRAAHPIGDDQTPAPEPVSTA